MSSSKVPTQQTLLPLSDPDCIQETVASELSSISVMNNGYLHLTFSMVRPSIVGMNSNSPKDERIVVDRVVLPTSAASQIADQFRQISHAVTLMQAQQPNKSN
jgi:hypothetical protein